MAECIPPPVRRVWLFVNPHKADAPVLAEEIAGELNRRSIDAVIHPVEGPVEREDPGGDFDLAFSLGGDGTVLYAARIAASRGLPILPINMGTLGFIAPVHPGEWLPVFQRYLAGTAGISRRLMLELRVDRRGKTFSPRVFLNDAVISASGIAKIIRLRVESENPEAREYIRLGHYRSDGLIVATPTGSTGYSVAAGGPILDPEIEAVIINPICPFTLSNRPMVIPAHETVVVEVEEEQRSGVLLTLDGQLSEPLEPGDRIIIRRAPCQARLIASDRRAFYRALRTKLNWPGISEGETDA
jgi:NAD+ kinase